MDQLQRLHEELDLADAAFAVLDVEAVVRAHQLALMRRLSSRTSSITHGEVARVNTVSGKQSARVASKEVQEPVGRAAFEIW